MTEPQTDAIRHVRVPRVPRAPRFAPPPPLPVDVRLMNAIAGALFVLTAAGAVAAGVLWLTRSPLFPIRHITLEGDLLRSSVPTIRANATPGLSGNFFSVDLQKSRSAFESVPWVRHAVVRRVWPDRLAVRLEEQQAAALWEGPEGGGEPDRLVNAQGEIFSANVGDVEEDGLPAFAGRVGEAPAMLSLYRRLQPVLATLEDTIARLSLSGRGSWRAEMAGGATLELGRGTEDEVVARTARFVRTLDQVTARWQGNPLEHVDLRHADGYAVRLRGVSTTSTPVKAPAPRAARKPAPARTH